MRPITNEDIKILGRLVNISTEGVVADASQVYDSTQRKNQEVINSEMKNKTKNATTTTYGIVRLASGKNDADNTDVPTIKILRDAIQDAIDGILEDPNHTLQDQLNSIRELANAINNDASFYTTIQNWLAQKADKSAFDTLKGRVDDLAERVAYLEECCEQVHQYMDEFSITWSGAGSSHVRISPAVLRAGTNTAVCTIDNGWHCSTPLTRSNVLGDYDTITQTGTDTNIQLVFTGVRSNIVINAPVTKTFFNITKHVVGADSTDTYPFEVVYSGTHANAQTIAAGIALNLTVTGKTDRDVFDEGVPVSITIGDQAYEYRWQNHVNSRIDWLNGDPHSITIQIPASDINGDIELFFNGWHESSSRIILKISPNPNVGSTPGWSFGDILDHDSNEKYDGINNDEPWYFLNYLWSDDWIQLEKTSALATAINNNDPSVYKLKVKNPSATVTEGVYTITASGNNGVNTSAIRDIFYLRVTPSGKDGSFSLNGNPQSATKDNTDYTLTVQTELVGGTTPSYGTVTVSPNHGTASRSTFSADGTPHTVTITPTSGYTTTGMNATTTNNDLTISVSGNTITVTGTSSNNATITVTLPAEGTPTPSGPATVNVVINQYEGKGGTATPSSGTATNGQFSSTIQFYQSDTYVPSNTYVILTDSNGNVVDQTLPGVTVTANPSATEPQIGYMFSSGYYATLTLSGLADGESYTANVYFVSGMDSLYFDAYGRTNDYSSASTTSLPGRKGCLNYGGSAYGSSAGDYSEPNPFTTAYSYGEIPLPDITTLNVPGSTNQEKLANLANSLVFDFYNLDNNGTDATDMQPNQYMPFSISGDSSTTQNTYVSNTNNYNIRLGGPNNTIPVIDVVCAPFTSSTPSTETYTTDSNNYAIVESDPIFFDYNYGTLEHITDTTGGSRQYVADSCWTNLVYITSTIVPTIQMRVRLFRKGYAIRDVEGVDAPTSGSKQYTIYAAPLSAIDHYTYTVVDNSSNTTIDSGTGGTTGSIDISTHPTITVTFVAIPKSTALTENLVSTMSYDYSS